MENDILSFSQRETRPCFFIVRVEIEFGIFFEIFTSTTNYQVILYLTSYFILSANNAIFKVKA